MDFSIFFSTHTQWTDFPICYTFSNRHFFYHVFCIKCDSIVFFRHSLNIGLLYPIDYGGSWTTTFYSFLLFRKRHRSGANSNDDNAVVNPPNINGVVVKIERDSPETDDSSYNSPRHNVVDPQCTTPPTKRTRLAVDAVPVAPSNACKSLQLYRGDNTKRPKSVNTNGGQTALAPIYAGMRAILKDHLGPAPLPLMAIPFNDSESDTRANPPIKSESLPATNHPVPPPQQPWLKCYNCNGYGHMSWSCSLASICFTCKKGGHFARSCPQTMCFKCGNFGHKSFNCRN